MSRENVKSYVGKILILYNSAGKFQVGASCSGIGKREGSAAGSDACPIILNSTRSDIYPAGWHIIAY